jgi:hypothetical protein
LLERILIAAVLALAALAGLQTVRLAEERTAHAETRTQAAAAKTAYANERTRVAVAFGKSVTQALTTQQELMTKAAKTQENLHATLNDLSAHRDRLLGELRDAKDRARADAADLSGAPQAAQPAGVRPDPAGGLVPRRLGERDVRSAYRADAIRAFAAACIRQHDDAQAALDAMK